MEDNAMSKYIFTRKNWRLLVAVQMFFPVSVISCFFVAIFVATSIIMRKGQHAYILSVIILFLWVNTSELIWEIKVVMLMGWIISNAFNQGDGATAGSRHVRHHQEHFVPWTLARLCFPPSLLSVSVELSCDSALSPNELVLSYEAVRLLHNITKERTSATLRADKRKKWRQRGRTGLCVGGRGGGREEKGGSVTRMWLINRMWCMRVCDTGPVTCQAVAHEWKMSVSPLVLQS